MLRVSFRQGVVGDPIAAAESVAWKVVKKGILISAVLTGIQIIYDVHCARKCSAAVGKRKK